MGWFDEGGSGRTVDVTAMLDSKSAERLWDMVQAGALVSVGLTSDGGALGVTITVDGQWRREYFRELEQLELWTEEAVDPVIEAAQLARASAAQRGRSRGAKRP